MMTRRLTAILLALAASGLTLADTITMKDGTKYEGKVLSEDTESYLVAIQVTASIKDERRLPKADIESIDRSSADDLAFEKIKDLVPTGDRLTTKDYDAMINKQVKAFVAAFPATKHKKQVSTILGTLQKERDLAESGALKLDGRWIPAADREANAFEIDARILLDEMKDAADAGRFQTAMRQFEQLDKDFSATDSYTKAVELANTVLEAYAPQMSGAIRRVDSLIPTRKGELDLLAPSQRTAAYDEIARRDKAYEALVEREKKMPTKWLSTEQYHKGPMTEVLRNIETEQKRLAGVNLDEIKKAGATYREAYAAAAAGEKELADPLFSTLKSIRVPARYVEALELKLAAKIAEMEAPEPTPDSSDPAPVADDGETPDSADASGEPAETAADRADEPSPDAVSADEPPVAPREPVDTDEGSPMKTILFIVMAAVLVIALIAVFAGKKKK